MSFAANGIYTAPAAATDAFPGKVIASADWNAIFVDIQTALSKLGPQSWVNVPTVISGSGSFTASPSVATYFIEASVPTLTIPLSSTRSYPLKVAGAATGIFSSHHMVVAPTSPDTLSGQTGLTLTADYQIITLYPLVSGGYIVGFN